MMNRTYRVLIAGESGCDTSHLLEKVNLTFNTNKGQFDLILDGSVKPEDCKIIDGAIYLYDKDKESRTESIQMMQKHGKLLAPIVMYRMSSLNNERDPPFIELMRLLTANVQLDIVDLNKTEQARYASLLESEDLAKMTDYLQVHYALSRMDARDVYHTLFNSGKSSVTAFIKTFKGTSLYNCFYNTLVNYVDIHMIPQEEGDMIDYISSKGI